MLANNVILVSLLASVVNAAPSIRPVQLSKRQSNITILSLAEIALFKPFTHFARASYCNSNTTINWSCANCAANPDFIPVASGGDGSGVQFWYVGFSPSQQSVIVAHQGTDPSQIQAIATDTRLYKKSLNSTLFPGFNSSIQVHAGFADQQAKTAEKVLSAVQTTIAAHNATQVTIVGHSLGAAIALLDGVYLPLHISGVSFRMIGYGMPRVGNQAFANYVDAHLNVKHVNNKEDFIPIMPGRLSGYRHPSGEVHIKDNNQWVSCLGQDNTSKDCTVGDVWSVLVGRESDHTGPYDGVTLGSC